MAGLDVCSRLGHRGRINELVVGHARVSTEQRDLTAQHSGLHTLGVGSRYAPPCVVLAVSTCVGPEGTFTTTYKFEAKLHPDGSRGSRALPAADR